MNLERAREALVAQPFSAMLGTRLLTFSAEGAALALDARADLRQQDGLVSGGRGHRDERARPVTAPPGSS
jgi:acyl-coenzyme A thioesterase PaaI-like protein